MSKVECPACGAPVTLGQNLRLRQRLSCPSCNEELEIIWLDPIELDWTFEDDDDDMDDDSDY